jgi:hypothetical protein
MGQATFVLVTRLPRGTWRPCQGLMVLLTVALRGANGTGDSTSACPPSLRTGSLLIRRIHLLPHWLPSLLLTTGLHGLHLLLLLVAAVDRFPHRTADWTPDVLTSVVMTQDVPGTDAVRHQAFLVFAFRNMFPQAFHTGAVRRHRTPTILMRTLGSVAEQEKALLLMSKDLLPVRYLPRTAASATNRPTRTGRWGARVILRHMLLSSNLRRRRGDLGHARLRWHGPLTAAARHGIDIVHINHVPTSRPRRCRGRLLLLQRHGGRHWLSSARAPWHRRLRPHRLLLLVLLGRLGHALAMGRRPRPLYCCLLLPGFDSMCVLGLHADVHRELLQSLLQRGDVLVCLEGRGRPIERFL